MIRRSWQKLFYGAVLAGLAAVASPSRAIIDNGPAGGGVTVDWDGVGEIEYAYDSTDTAIATATLLDPTHVLTAGHTVYDAATSSAAPTSLVTFVISGTVYHASAINLAPGYSQSAVSSGGTYVNDLAIVTLSAPVTGHTTYGYNTGQINETASSEPTTLVGYGVGGQGATGQDPTNYPIGTKRAAINQVDQDTDQNTTVNGAGTLPQHLLVYDFDNYSAGTNGPLGGPALGVNEGDTTNGDSGGPMFQKDPTTGQYLVTGVTSDGVDDNPTYGDISWGTRVADYSSFIEQLVPAPEPVSMAPVVFGIGLLLRRKPRK